VILDLGSLICNVIVLCLVFKSSLVREKSGFAEISKNLIGYRSENNFVRLSK